MHKLTQLDDLALAVGLEHRLKQAGIEATRTIEHGPADVYLGGTACNIIWIADPQRQDEAMAILDVLREELKQPVGQVDCPKCGESSPATFEICWSCGEATQVT